MMIKIVITTSPNKRITGVELRRVMSLAGLTTYALAKRLGSGWPQSRLYRMVGRSVIDLHPVEMIELLKALGASSLSGKEKQ